MSEVEEGTFPATYKIIRGMDAPDLANAVNLAMRAGWEPSGGVMYAPPNPLDMTGNKSPHPFWQALVKPS